MRVEWQLWAGESAKPYIMYSAKHILSTIKGKNEAFFHRTSLKQTHCQKLPKVADTAAGVATMLAPLPRPKRFVWHNFLATRTP